MDFVELRGVSIPQFAELVHYANQNELITWLQNKELLARRRACVKCHNDMTIQHKSSVVDKKVWRCTDRVSDEINFLF